MTQVTIEQAMQRAIGHHQAGRLGEAEALYRRVLAQRPDQHLALHLLGLIAADTGHAEEAITLIGRAIALNPGVAAYHGNLGEVYRKAGQWEPAIACFRRVIALEPAHAEAHHRLGNVLRSQGRRDEAIIALERAVALDPNLAGAYRNLGETLHETSRFEEAAAVYRQALVLRPEDAALWSHLGSVLSATGQLDQALDAFHHALALDPDHIEAHANLGAALHVTGRLDEAIATYRKALALRGDAAVILNNLGNALREAGRPDEAIAAFERAIALRPGSAVFQNSLGAVLHGTGRIDDAIACYRRALALAPDHEHPAGNLLFALHYHPDCNAQTLLDEHRQWAARFAAPLAQAGAVRPHTNDRTPSRRLRIGFVSPDFRDHPVGRMLRPLFTHHDRDQYEFLAYSDVRRRDAVTAALEAQADAWHSIVGRSDAQVADRIRQDRVDILVDLSLHTDGNRMLVFARKPAPVQVTMLGLPSTTGQSTIDYRLTDPYLDPPGTHDADYSEQSIRLPHCFWIFQPPDAPVPVSALPAAGNGHVTFGCLGQFAKISRPAEELWMTILQRVPGARLVIQAPPGSHVAAFQERFRQAGIAAERLTFLPWAGHMAYFPRYHAIDLGLDPFPYNGHTTTLDALWMGVPVITLAGGTAVGRGGVSILSNAGLTELIAPTAEQYVELAVAWASDQTRLAALRAELRPRMEASPLMNGKQYTADVEAALRRMWRTWCNSELGEWYRRTGQLDAAIAAFQRAHALATDDAEILGRLARVLQEAGRRDEAIVSYQEALALRPDLAEAHNNLANLLAQKGEHDAAIAAYARAIALRPDLAQPHNNLGTVLISAGRHEEAMDAFRHALTLQPQYASALNNLGSALRDVGKLDDARDAIERAIALRPGYASAYQNLGNIHCDAGRLDEALAALEEAIALDPGVAGFYSGRGVVLLTAGRFEEAIAAFERAIALDPGHVEAHNNLGLALLNMGRLEEAAAACRRAHTLKPDDAQIHNNLGHVFKDQARLDEALDEFAAAAARAPGSSKIASNYLMTLHFHPDYDAQALLAEHRRWAARQAGPLASEIRPHDNDPTPDRRLRVGFVSPDFRNHPVGNLLLPLFAHHDVGNAEFLCYSNVPAPDPVTRRLHALSDGWYSIVGQSDAQVAQRVRRDRIDILVDLALHTAGNRLLVFARKPAPVQVTMLGMPGTTGLSTIDYRLTDPYYDPPGAHDADYSEQSIRLPHTFWCYQPAADAPSVGDLPALSNGFITLGCLNQFAKLSTPALGLWVRLLQSLPGSRLVLHAPAGSSRDRVRAFFENAGIAAERLSFAARVEHRDYLLRYRVIDLCLDPFPYTGGLTTMDALWMGVPVITLAGRTAVGRSGVSILSNVGLTEFIARSPEQYLALAVEWANDRQRLAALRAGLRTRMQASPLLDGKQYAEAVEAAFRRMWACWCAGSKE